MRPPCRSTMDRAIQRPRPMPLSSGSSPARRTNRPNRISSSPSGRPGPSSSTESITQPGSTAPETRMALPEGANWLALAKRFTGTCTSRGASPITRGSDLQPLLALIEQRAPRLGRLLDHLVERHRDPPDRTLPRVEPDALQEVVDEPRQAQRAALHRQHQPARLRGVDVAQAVAQHL